jgi:hypothetical protein
VQDVVLWRELAVAVAVAIAGREQHAARLLH